MRRPGMHDTTMPIPAHRGEAFVARPAVKCRLIPALSLWTPASGSSNLPALTSLLPMRPSRSPRALALLLLALALASASGVDTIILKNGEKIEGRIVDDTSEELTVEYKVSASINDSRTIPKGEIEKIEKESPDEVAYEKLRNLKPQPNGYPAAAYEQIIAALQGFLDQHPQSPHKEEIAKTLEEFTDEKERIEGGEIKLGGKWLTREVAEKERYQLSGQVLFGQMQDAARRGELVGALNLFDQIEKNYPGSYAFPDAVDWARQVAVKLKDKADRGLQNWKQQKAQRDQGNQLASETERPLLLAAQQREQAQNDAAIEAATRARVKWIPYLPTSEKGLTTLATAAVTEQRRLDSIQVQKMRESIALSEKGRSQLAEKEPAAEATLREATRLWAQNEVALRLQKEAAAVAAAAKAATPTPKPTPAATPGAAGSPATARSAPPASSSTPAPATETPGEERSNFFLTPTGGAVILGVLVLVFGALKLYTRLKGKPPETVE
jgi:hypothetical protein